jgi:hypothetical protein
MNIALIPKNIVYGTVHMYERYQYQYLSVGTVLYHVATWQRVGCEIQVREAKKLFWIYPQYKEIPYFITTLTARYI